MEIPYGMYVIFTVPRGSFRHYGDLSVKGNILLKIVFKKKGRYFYSDVTGTEC
jgi:hypothetical protein